PICSRLILPRALQSTAHSQQVFNPDLLSRVTCLLPFGYWGWIGQCEITLIDKESDQSRSEAFPHGPAFELSVFAEPRCVSLGNNVTTMERNERSRVSFRFSECCVERHFSQSLIQITFM